MTERELFELIKTRYDGEGFAVLSTVRNQTGFGNDIRTADALVFSLWPSRGLTCSGFEIKSNKHDLESELKNPAKADGIAQYMNYWWLVLAEGKEWVEELKYPIPHTWGVLLPNDAMTKLVIYKQALPLEPKPWTMEFVCSVIRSTERQLSGEAQIADITTRAKENGYEQGFKDGGRTEIEKAPKRAKEHDRLVAALKQFEDQSGVKIEEYTGENVGKAVKVVTNLLGYYADANEAARHIRGTAERLNSLADRVAELLGGKES